MNLFKFLGWIDQSTCIWMIAVSVRTGHTVKRVMWFRVSADGRREFVHHSDPNEVSLSYRGRTRYEKDPFHSSLIVADSQTGKVECKNLSKKWIVRSSYIGGSYSSCSVQIRVVKLSDAGDYHFRFETDQPLGRWTSPNTVRLDVTGISTQAETAASSPLSASLPLAASIFPLRASMSECAQTCRFRCTHPGPPTCLAWERPCLWAVRPEVVLLQGGASRCTGVVDIQLSYWQCWENSAAVVLKVGAPVLINNTGGCTAVLQNGIWDINTFKLHI